MKRYADPENDRNQYFVSETSNGYTIQVLVLTSGAQAPLTPSVAAQLHIKLPETFRLQSCAKEDAEKQLDELAALNGWVPIE